MRRFAVRFLIAALFAGLVSPVLLAQQPGGGGMRVPGLLLTNKSVQEDLKLTPEQVEKFNKVAADMKEEFGPKMKEAFEAKDREKTKEVFKAMEEKAHKEMAKASSASLKPEQTKRLKQIEIQTSGLRAFSQEEVQKTLKLTEAQTKEITTLAEEIQKDSDEIMKEVRPADGSRPDRTKMAEARKKIQTLHKDGMEKITGTLTDEQKATWKEMIGEKFELKVEPRRAPGTTL